MDDAAQARREDAEQPRYRDLPMGSAEGVFGPDDRLGCLNRLTPARTAAAARLVLSGRVFSLNAPVIGYPRAAAPADHSAAPCSAPRGEPRHVVLRRSPFITDDYLDGFFPQASSQWDHFLHFGDPVRKRFYNDMALESDGVASWAQRGIVGRGVLLDVARWAATTGRPIDWRTSRTITADDLRVTAAQGVTVQPGSILCVRVGWQEGLDALGPGEPGPDLSTDPLPPQPGLAPSAAIAELLWDWGVAAIGADNVGLEVFPFPDHAHSLHVLLLARLGMPIGELWSLDDLAHACAEERRFEFLFTSAPLHLPGGVGSPANALALL